MMLKRVHLRNFISHKDSELKFDYGINVIVGPNGAGKTSILDAVSFGLFNVHSRGRNENLVNRSAEGSNVVVEFSEGGVHYAVEWDIDRKRRQVRGHLFRVHNGRREIIAGGGGRVVVSEIKKITGLDEHLFLQSVYVQQGEIERLVTETPSNRKEIISRLLGIEDLERAYQLMREVISEYENIISSLDGELKRKPEVESRIQNLKLEIEGLGSSLSSEMAKLEKIEKEISALEVQLKELNRKKDIFSGLVSRRAVLDMKIANLTSNLKQKEAELEEAEAAFAKIESLKESVARLPLMEDYYKLYRRLSEREKDMNYEHQKLKHVEELMGILARNERSYENYRSKNLILGQKREERRIYEGAKEGLIQLERLYKETLEKREKITMNLAQLLSECSLALDEEVTCESIGFVLNKKKRELSALKAELEKRASNIKERIGSVKNRIEDLEFKLSSISETDVCPICGRELNPEHRLRLQEEFEKVKCESLDEMKSLHQELENIEVQKRACEKSLENMASIDPKRVIELASEIKNLDNKVGQYLSEIEVLRNKAEILERIDSELKGLEDEIKGLEEAYREYDSAKRELGKWPSKEEIEAKLDEINREIITISSEMETLVSKLGYRPVNPEKELAELRLKKSEYDRNEPLAKKKGSLQIQVQNLRSEVATESMELERVKAEILELAYDESYHRQVQQIYDVSVSERTKVISKISWLRAELERARKEKESSEEELRQLLEKERERTRVEGFVRILQNIRSAFHKDGIQRLIRARSRPMLERLTRDFLERFNLEFSDVQIDDDYNISVVGPAGLQGIEQISGGERVALAISLRLAIARVLSGKVETIIMDEPTTHLDEERRRELVSILNSFFREGGRIIPQIIVITHHHEVEDAADIIYNVSKKEGFSIVESGES
ncbi:MAG: AAA family ATPase [Candidatus Bathyarchaeia archaeon]|nr:AAA family ATPase [Candidatus Bathyarchaeota archaeon]